jgi:hypothetical protein
MHLPAGHAGRADHPLYVDFLNLAPAAAGWVIKALLLGLVAAYLWWARGAVRNREDPQLLWELAALALLMLLFSPITWGQHCVALLPAWTFVAAFYLRRGALPRWMLGVAGFYVVFVLLLSRDVVGRDLAYLLGSYHVETAAIIGLLAVVVSCRRLQPAAQP